VFGAQNEHDAAFIKEAYEFRGHAAQHEEVQEEFGL
jgi:hypothetical protein